MKRRNRIVKPSRACDDWYEDDALNYYPGSAYDMNDSAPRFRSVSEAAHHAMRAVNRPVIGFHRPKA
jgi:hypothetical protein